MDENANELMWVQYNSLVLITWKYKCTLLVFNPPQNSQSVSMFQFSIGVRSEIFIKL